MAKYRDEVSAKHQAMISQRKESRTSNPSTNKKGKETESRRPNYEVITPLTTSRATLLEDAFNFELIVLPSQGVDKSKYCRYHQNYSHTIELCLTLRDKIEELTNHKRRETTPKHEEPRKLNRESEGTLRLWGIINTIARAFAGGFSSSSRTRYLCMVNNVHSEDGGARRKQPQITFIN
ncbi:hypothetical protein CR513_31719, partial [Mucuna pruriens]